VLANLSSLGLLAGAITDFSRVTALEASCTRLSRAALRVFDRVLRTARRRSNIEFEAVANADEATLRVGGRSACAKDVQIAFLVEVRRYLGLTRTNGACADGPDREDARKGALALEATCGVCARSAGADIAHHARRALDRTARVGEGRHGREHRRLVTERLEQLPSELDQEVVLVRAPLDLEELVDRVQRLAGTRDEHGALVVAQVDEPAVGEGLVHLSREGNAHVTHDHAALEVHLVRNRLGQWHDALRRRRAHRVEDHVDVLDLGAVHIDVALGVHAVRRARLVGLRASPAASRGSLCGGSGRGVSVATEQHHYSLVDRKSERER